MDARSLRESAEGDTAGRREERMRRVERGIRPEPLLRSAPLVRVPLAERMAYHAIPGVSIAVISDYELAWARGYGVREAGTSEPVTERTLFQAASISKAVTAVAALRLVERGTLALDRDVNDYLTSWQVPANGDWQPRITLRQILSHTAGVTVHGFPGYPRGHAVPSLRQILDGERPANSLPIRVNAVPGTQFRYSGGGYTVLQQVLEDVTGQPFAPLLRELVLDPLGMRASTFEQPLPAARWAEAASGHRTGGGVVAGGWHVYPERAAAGLWTTAGDLARFATELQRTFARRGSGLLRPETVEQMLSRQIEEEPGLDFGLGVQLSGEGTSRRFSHSGGNEGYRCDLIAYVTGGCGAVVMTNGDEGPALVREIERAIAAEYGWPDYLPQTPPVMAMGPEALRAFAGSYELWPSRVLLVRPAEGALTLEVAGQPPMLFRPVSDVRFVAEAVDTELVFERDGSGETIGLMVRQNGADLPALRTP